MTPGDLVRIRDGNTAKIKFDAEVVRVEPKQVWVQRPGGRVMCFRRDAHYWLQAHVSGLPDYIYPSETIPYSARP